MTVLSKYINKKRILFIGFMLLSLMNIAQTTPNYKNPNLPFAERAKDLVSRMTLQEKVSQMTYNAEAIPRLSIPAYNWWNECLHGVARSGVATVFPQAIGMASMWNASLMYQIATAISDEARAKHQRYVSEGKRGIYEGLTFWTPNINIFRDPRWGRGQETYGEDPFLTGTLAVNFIKGLQGNDPKYLKLVATAKHFSMYSGPESARHRFDAIPTDRDFVETYTPQFEMAVKDAHVYSVMCAYNSFEHFPCCGNRKLSDLVRNEWGFKGYIVSDCWAVADFYKKDAHAIVPNVEQAAAMSLKAGTDLNCGNSYPSLVTAVKLGLVSEQQIDTSVTRLMEARLRLGMFAPQGADKYKEIPYSVVNSKEHQALALKAARESMVLLKNENHTLPFSKDVKVVAVIGPNANDAEVLLGNYHGYPSAPVTLLAGIKAMLPNAKVLYTPGCHVADGLPLLQLMPTSVLYTDKSMKVHGLKVEYFDNSDFKGRPLDKHIDAHVDFVWWAKAPYPDLNASHFSARWTGVFVPPVTGKYALGGEAFSGMKLYLNDSLILSRRDIHESLRIYHYLTLQGGKPYRIKLEYVQDNTEYANMQLLWEQPAPDMEQKAYDIAKKADIVIYAMGLSPLIEGEEMDVSIPGFLGGDRTKLSLPEEQTALMQKIEQLHKPSVMVMMNGGAVACNWEQEHLPAILEAWYPGQAGGTAIADILFGDYNPSGRLPVTFYRSVKDIPPFTDYSMEGRTYKYFKGNPLYEFGYGLSYSSFTYSNMQAPQTISVSDSLPVSVDITNTGKMDGHEVVEVYITHLGNPLMPIRALVGFTRVSLKAGETKRVTVMIPNSQLYQLTPSCQKAVLPGGMIVSIGGRQPDSLAIQNHQAISQKVVIQ
ncbi:glycoside hydrolase family 3 C-terminal domain-containing protein [Microbacter margulisiae]|uniref:Beta-glucosidase n=1 Tax=Microbacter margulisiae TaxID=1350067 RepID=A0A7W5H310_9PORP|nr:glycoside hydrolase family 3 C-terminal domain-containing protein [Microbacter margulisiae]MBB3188119.1 beta-glucosidase [Microbacter margulisiae]